MMLKFLPVKNKRPPWGPYYFINTVFWKLLIKNMTTGGVYVKWVRKEKFAELTGITKHAVAGKIREGVWREGVH
jgi:hypothetical protein